MAARVIEQAISKVAVTKDNVAVFIERELKPFIRQCRAAVNDYVRRPTVPVHDAAPVTDLVVDPSGKNPPQDGYLSASSVDGKLYCRIGSSTHIAIGP